MSRDFFISGESLIQVKGPTNSSIASLTQFGLTTDKIRISPTFKHKDITVDAWGGEAGPPVDVQFMLAELAVSMNVVHIDRAVLDECLRLSMAGAPAVGQLPRAGTRMGGGLPRFSPGNNYMGLNITSPVGSKPWRFFFSYLMTPPLEIPVGTEKSIFNLQWRVIPYNTDPWNAGLGAQGVTLWDYNTDS